MTSTKNIAESPGVRLLLQVSLVVLAVARASAQAPPGSAARPFDILDNSFLVEEAFNQEPGIFQNIFGVQLDGGDSWDFGFTQEWPVASQRHQLSYTVPVARLGGSTGVGDVMVNYRYQLSMEGPGRPAFSPRISVILPSGREADGLGAGVVGWQVNLPFSKQRGDLYYHWGGGFTWLPGVDAGTGTAEQVSLLTPHAAASAIWRTGPMFNLMLESVLEFAEETAPAGGTTRTNALTISPGFRTGWNLADQQVIVGFAVPVTFAEDARDAAAFVYVSYELPFR